MGHCLKCQGSLKYDLEFPGFVCQRCGVVYYINAFAGDIKVQLVNRRRSGWHQLKTAV